MKKILKFKMVIVFSLVFYSHQTFALTTYNIGNSLTWDAVNAGGMEDVFSKGGVNLIINHHINCGSSLANTLANSNKTCISSKDGHWNEALVNNFYDMLILQPFEGGATETEITAMQSFVAMVSTNTQIVLYEAYPGFDDAKNISDYYLLPDQVAFGETQAEYQAVREAFPDAIIIRAMEVIVEIDVRARRGEIPGITSAQDLYRDKRHFGNLGKYILSLTFYSSLTNLVPELTGLDLHARFQGVTKKQAIAVQKTVKAVIIDNSNLKNIEDISAVNAGSWLLESFVFCVLILLFRNYFQKTRSPFSI